MKPKHIEKTDKSGKPFTLGVGGIEDLPALLEMYRNFSPKPASQGLPPADPETCHHWVKTFFEVGENILAWRGDRIIGHASLIPDIKGESGEFVVFVDQDHRNLEIGTELTWFTLDRARQLGFNSIWLTVSLSNFIAIKLYRKLGFEYCDQDKCERMMRIKLRSGQSTEDINPLPSRK